MKINELKELLSARLLTCPNQGEQPLSTAYAGDMLSDVLALGAAPDVLLTGLLNPQVIRTAEMLDTACVVFVRDKAPTEAMLALAEKSGICVLVTGMEMYPACGQLFSHGLAGLQ